MGANSEVFLKMTEEHYLNIPDNVREMFLTSKRIDSENSDWNENMKDLHFEKLYNKKKEITKQLDERKFELREQRRNQK